MNNRAATWKQRVVVERPGCAMGEPDWLATLMPLAPDHHCQGKRRMGGPWGTQIPLTGGIAKLFSLGGNALLRGISQSHPATHLGLHHGVLKAAARRVQGRVAVAVAVVPCQGSLLDPSPYRPPMYNDW